MNAEPPDWPREAICLRRESRDVESLAAELYRRTCRVDFDQPGVCVLELGPAIDSVGCRGLMVDLKRAMARIHEATTGRTLIYLSATRFDQQETTRPHLDGGPEECLLMLGYEPTAIESELEIFDYARCAFDHGLSPQEFMAAHNPMFEAGQEILRPYAMRVPCFSRTEHRIVCINNSSAAWSESEPAWQGVLHTATIPAPDESERRVVDSTMIAPAPPGTPDAVDDDALDDFVTSSVVRRRGAGA
jgi:hypothetical protein